MRRLIPIWALLALFFCSCSTMSGIADTLCEEDGISSEITAGIDTGATALAGIVGPIGNVIGWGAKLGIETFCFAVGAVLKAPETLSEEGLELIGLGAEAATEEATPDQS